MAHKNQSNWSPLKERQQAKDKAKAKEKTSPTDRAPAKSGFKTAHKKPAHQKPTESFSFGEADDRIYAIFRNHGFKDFPHKKRQQLTRFYELLMANQKQQNFTRLLTLREVAIKHFIDSLMVSQVTQLSFPLLDMGTGPGFPGIPLKIVFPNEKIILAEGVQKRVDFLKQVRDDLKLPELDIIGRNVNPEFVYPVQGVITRAVEDARNTLGNVISCVQTGGRVFLMKGPNVDPEIKMALDQWGEYFTLENDIAYSLPETPHERRLLIFKKIKAAPLLPFSDMVD